MNANELHAALTNAIDLAERDHASEGAKLHAASIMAREAVRIWIDDATRGQGEQMAWYLATRAAALHESFMPITEALHVPDHILEANMPGGAS